MTEHGTEVFFFGEHTKQARYTILFSPEGTIYSATKHIPLADASSYVSPTRIDLTRNSLDAKLNSMELGISTEKEFRKFLDSCKYN